MSLHLGNLSPRVQRHELERIFRRFGRCTVQIKDKFGFVVYEYPANAEQALGALRGTRICGERITLSWSKKQPQPPQSSDRRGRKYEQLQGRHFPNDQQNRRRGFQKANVPPDLIHGAKAETIEGYVGGKGRDYFPDTSEEARFKEANNLEVDTWKDEVIKNNLENGRDFDQYEPCLGDDINLQRESTQRDCSPTLRNSQEKSGMEQVCDVALEQANCVQRLKSSEHVKNNYQEKKRSNKEWQPSDEEQLKKARVSPSIHSIHTASGSQSPTRSTKALSGPHPWLRSKSMASKKQTLSSSLRSGSMSSHLRTRKNVSRQISRSPSPKSSVILDQPFLSFPNKMQINHDHMVSSFPGDLKEGSLQVGNDISRALVKPEVDERNTCSSRGYETHSIMGNVDGIKRSCLSQSEDRGQNPGTCSSKKIKELGKIRGETEAVQRSTVASLMNLSSKETREILKNCGQKYPGEVEKDVPPTMYFGCGRLWPWEVIYYRRLKKGPISMENYARRLSQNQQFAIVDKYIRSSSGWGEVDDENC